LADEGFDGYADGTKLANTTDGGYRHQGNPLMHFGFSPVSNLRRSRWDVDAEYGNI
jgi:hypothetical protein